MNHYHVQYFAVLREQAGTGEQSVSSAAGTPAALYEQLRAAHGFTLAADQLRAVVNEEFVDWQAPLQDGDRVVFIPPVAGG